MCPQQGFLGQQIIFSLQHSLTENLPNSVPLKKPEANSTLQQGSPTPGPWTGTSPWPVRNRAAQQEVGDRASEASSVFTAASPHRSHHRLSSASCQHYGAQYNYFIIYYNAIIIEIKCTINVMRLNHPETDPGPWKNCLPQNRSLVPKRLGTAALQRAPDIYISR